MTSATPSTSYLPPTDREKRRRERQSICPESQEIASRWARDEKRLDQCELEVRYQWAKDIKHVCERASIYGWDCAERLMDLQLTCPVDRTTYMIVATYIDDAFFRSVVEFNNCKKPRWYHITWSHLVLLAGLADSRLRDILFERCKLEHWSRRTLRQRIDTHPPTTSVNPSLGASQPKVGTVARRLESAATKLSQQLAVVVADPFMESAKALPHNSRENTKWAVYTSREAAVRCMAQLEQAVRVLDAALETLTLEHQELAPPAAVDAPSYPLIDWIDAANERDATTLLPKKRLVRKNRPTPGSPK
jgi:hypothetical protein